MPPRGFDASKLADARSFALTLMVDTCTIREQGLVTDGQGGKMKGTTSTQTLVPCLVEEPSGMGQPDQGLKGENQETIMRIPYSIIITNNALIDYGGKTYEISEVLSDKTLFIYHRFKLERV